MGIRAELAPEDPYLIARNPKLDAELSSLPHKCQIHGNSHFLGPPGYGFATTVQDVIGHLYHRDTLLTDI